MFQCKPDLTTFVTNGMFESDMVDSTDSQLNLLRTRLHPDRSTNDESVGSKRQARTPPKPPRPAKKPIVSPHTQHYEKASGLMETLSKSLEMFASGRPLSSAPSLQPRQSASERSAAFKLLDELRSRIETMTQELKTASGHARTLLQEDLDLYIAERSAIRKELLRDSEV
ncbi:hypothetical protein PINS_up016410 [Pythium insidiosum]|nr:hypothetical protein PINS_up016410 [Pythium insidiosum]